MLVGGAFLAGVVATVLVVLFATSGHKYDEDAHRAAVEEFIGHEVADWDAYREVVQEVCEEDESGFGMFIAVTADKEGLEGLALTKIDIQHACPDREEEFDEVLDSLPIGS
jgi:hypothetical protein